MVTGASEQFHALVEEDLNRERASVLGRAGRRLAQAIDSCAEAEDAYGRAAGAGDHRRLALAARAYREAYEGYERMRTEFCIQREANRLFDHRLIARFYPPPPPPATLGAEDPSAFDR